MQLSRVNQKRLAYLANPDLENFIRKAVEICEPEKITILTDQKEDLEYIRNLALKNNEEIALDFKKQSCHFDSYSDQARDKENTKYLIEAENSLDPNMNYREREEGLESIYSTLKGTMQGKEMLINFYTLGPADSIFSIPAVQITDSAYVLHSEDLLYREGYQDFKNLEGSNNFFAFLHSAGELKNNVSKNTDNRKVYIDLKKKEIFSVNTQYAGNSLGLKKLAFRLAIKKAAEENWLAEHMFISSIENEANKKTYLAGAFPSGCGKTSTAMIPGHKIVGDDLAYLKNVGGRVKAANVEKGVFGIINDLKEKNNPIIYQALNSAEEVIYSNLLINDGRVYWEGMGRPLPEEGINHSGKWYRGKKDSQGNEIPASNPNARFTLKIDDLDNCDENFNDQAGVEIEGIIFGGRDSDTSVPVAESFDWKHGVFEGATLESETTAATLGDETVREHSPMAISDFLSLPLGEYISNYIDFAENLTKIPKIFTVNYFLKDEAGNFLNAITDKKVWLRWMEGRINNKYDAIKTPIGYLPEYQDLKDLFQKYLNKDYKKEDYRKQFSIRIDENLKKLARIEESFLKMYNEGRNETAEKSFSDLKELPAEFITEMKKQRQLLQKAKDKYNSSVIKIEELR